ncbi:hypothetical protein TrLO_g4719 [Triparma laevis f. longispina]|uniref:Uncharacterized protein n=1 Tax=Triparma laevis f. longispina TaxID=1714387 RepID=A0A9W7FB69_9STRA|nr:hypothetical protein TrLO_g4719 [Triparma laevis f. longispina]
MGWDDALFVPGQQMLKPFECVLCYEVVKDVLRGLPEMLPRIQEGVPCLKETSFSGSNQVGSGEETNYDEFLTRQPITSTNHAPRYVRSQMNNFGHTSSPLTCSWTGEVKDVDRHRGQCEAGASVVLMEALKIGDADAVIPLMKKVDINRFFYVDGTGVKPPNGSATALQWSIFMKKTENFKVLLMKNDVDVNKSSSIINSPLAWTAALSKLDLFKLLFTKDSLDIAALLVQLSINGNVDAVKTILSTDETNVNACVPGFNNSTALFAASEHGRTEVVKLLLATDGIDVNKGLDGCSNLCIASCRGHVEVVKLLLAKAGIEMTMSLYGASQNGRTDVVKALLENAKADVDASLPDGTTVLITALGGGRTEIIKMLLDVEGIDVEKKTEDGLTALAVAKKYQNADIVALLKPNTNKKDPAKKCWQSRSLPRTQVWVICLSQPNSTTIF